MTDENTNKMRVILCRPGEKAETIEMEDSLKAMQEMVGGMIEEYMPWEDEVAIICNDEGKMMGLPHTKCPGVFLRGISSMNYLAKSDGSIGLIISAWNTPCARMRPSN